MHCADRLAQAVHETGGPVCVGLDPVLEKLPGALSDLQPAAAFAQFSIGVVDAVRGIAAAVKFQSACYERLGPAGMSALAEATAHAASAGMVVILDGKRGDIGISAQHYASASRSKFHAQWSTVNPYMGEDSIAPFLQDNCGAFALVRTSNPSGDALQCLRLADGTTLCHAVAAMIDRIGSHDIGSSGYSSLGAVVGATKSTEIAALRALMPRQWFLVPGYGAQGGGADDVLQCFDAKGLGAIITASRSVIYPQPQSVDWKSSIARAAAAMREELRRAMAQ